MRVPQMFYRIIYQQQINYILRNITHFINKFIKIYIQIPPSGFLTLRTNSGKLKIATNQTSYLTQLLFWEGYENFEYTSIFEELIKNVDCFLDIGSNIGYYSLLAAKSNPKVIVYAFEPAIGPKYYLNKNIQINNFQNNIISESTALSNQIGEIEFYEVENVKYKYLKYNLAGEGNAGTKTTSRNFVKNKVISTTLNEFIKTKGINKIDLIKLDTEGTEIDILNSGLEYIKKFEPIIICETLFNTIEEQLEDFFGTMNYSFFNHTESGLIQVKSLKRLNDNNVRNCFFVPKAKFHLISKFISKN